MAIVTHLDMLLVERKITSKELARRISAFLKGAGEAERGVFIARYFYLQPVNKIAEAYGYSVSKTKSILFRTRKRMKEYLEKGGV